MCSEECIVNIFMLAIRKWRLKPCIPFCQPNYIYFVYCIFFRLRDYQKGKTWHQFSRTWEENICMERKGCLQKAHSSLLCPDVCSNGVNQRDLSNQEMASFSIQSFCLFCLVSLPPNFEAQWLLLLKHGCWHINQYYCVVIHIWLVDSFLWGKTLVP